MKTLSMNIQPSAPSRGFSVAARYAVSLIGFVAMAMAVNGAVASAWALCGGMGGL